LLDSQGKYVEAKQLCLRALSVFERVYGPEHYDIAVNLNNLAAVYQATGRGEEAEQRYRRALAIFERTLEPRHPKLIACRDNYEQLRKQETIFRQGKIGHET